MAAASQHRAILRGLVVVAASSAAITAVAGLLGGGDTPLVSTWVLFMAVVAAAAACGVRAAAGTGDRVAWAILAGGMVCWAAGEAVYELVVARQAPQPVPSVADVLWLAEYPAVALALALLVRAQVGRIPPRFWIDTALGVCAIAAGAAALLPDAVSTGTFVDALYPAGDVLLIVLVAGAVGLASDAWSPTLTLLAGAFVAQVVADAAYSFAGDGYVAGGPADIGWPVAALLVASAAAHGRVRRRARSSRSSLWTVATFGLIALAMQVADHFVRTPDATVVLSALGLVLVLVRVVLLLGANARLLDERAEEARIDTLTGLPNRRALMEALESPRRPELLALYDLDGFKAYNDAFGHPAGDALLRRLAERLARFAVREDVRAFRLGGDEFCVLIPAGPHVEAVAAGVAATMAETGAGFHIAASCGTAPVPHPGGLSGAMSQADTAMYAAKREGRRSAAQQAGDVLDAAIRAHDPGLAEHNAGVAQLAGRVAAAVGMHPVEAEQTIAAARLHDLGRITWPEEPAGATEHALMGERIVAAAPDLAPVARLVRAGQERWDGEGSPDGLAGEAIPLGSRVIAACDAFTAMTTGWPAQPAQSREAALEELQRNAGSRFDPGVVGELTRLLVTELVPARPH